MFNNEEDKKYKNDLLNWMKSKIQGAIISPIHEDDILFPVCDEVTKLLIDLRQNQDNFHMRSFNIIVEQLENVLYRMYVDDETCDLAPFNLSEK
ncbi:hypothetical protein TVAG_537050 [Trichomonas vaginalis G3]|uniref:Uncharacterized protein n=1 Tax=Trichomonas vaginalis (strain ATCC PRA-98 / G3) TaxID=412133 RepID=A2HAN5_TRIV3|nr:ATPase activity, coupled to transmembrane movement of substances [Trichomonas vaginalis G3]EAX73532.1 hypothetical protein TVAG_537050 [Trichomonas vaginalis G3]KAI5524535.1 ATPase activity, coupled to transmembrane movement of substances [Trichomonas vaginalis G3]|eukprot:XP_001286462.1 hypothetical protein [Trichomonas vaginalis G3]